MKSFPYKIVVTRDSTDGEFIADVPALEYCSVGGRTEAEARREAVMAGSDNVAARRVAGLPIPPPDLDTQE